MDSRRLVQLSIFSLALTLSACATNEVTPPDNLLDAVVFDTSLFGERPSIEKEDDLFELREAQRSAFLRYYEDPANQVTPPHERIYNYLLSTTADFDFHNDTRTASAALDSSSGNCLSLAILTTGLARLVGVETGYQLVDSTPVFERRGSVVSKGIHVRSILYDPNWEPEHDEQAMSIRPGIRFDYFPDDTQRARLLGNLSPAAYVAMYYSNVAGEAIASDDIDSAFWYLLESLEHNEDNAIALNMMAVVYRRAGDEAMAERIYKRGIARAPDKVSFLRNYRYLLRQQGRHAEADTISKSLAKLDDQNPFNWVNAGRSALADGEYSEAIRYFRQAIKIAPYLHEAHALMAVAHLRLGNKSRGERELRRALENAERETTRSLYQAKLTMLDR